MQPIQTEVGLWSRFSFIVNQLGVKVRLRRQPDFFVSVSVGLLQLHLAHNLWNPLLNAAFSQVILIVNV